MGQSGEPSRSIKTQLARIVLIPSVTFLLLFAVLSAVALGQAISLKIAAHDGGEVLELREASAALQEERRLAAAYLGAPNDDLRSSYTDQIDTSDELIERARPKVENLRSRGSTTVTEQAEELLSELVDRADLRTSVLEEDIERPAVIDGYSQLVQPGNQLFSAAGRSLNDGSSVAEGSISAALIDGHEALSRADAVLSGALNAGELTAQERADFTGLISQLRRDLQTNATHMSANIQESYTELTNSEAWTELEDLTDEVSEHQQVVQLDPSGEVVENGDGLGVDGSAPADSPATSVQTADWRPAAEQVNAELDSLAEEQWHQVLDVADTAGNQLLTLAVGGGILAFFAGTLAFGIASRSSHRIVRRLLRLREDSLSLAKQDMPRIVERLERGESVDLSAEVNQLDYGSDEVGQVASAFNIAQRTAVAAAVRQSDIRAGANRVFLGIAHRNQSLVQRQLELLDQIERQEEDPDLLEELFRLDHLATRGRRHAENLIILGGGQPGRRWRLPVPLVDVLRGAVSETEEYTRVRLRATPELSLRGSAVADVLHLVAELIENATAFSPPHTEVQIHAEMVPKGVVVEIEDRGLGMTEADLAAANKTLDQPPEFDVMALTEDSRLGLFVVARLARRHGIAIQLRPSPYGGTRAIILIPGENTAPSEQNSTVPPRSQRLDSTEFDSLTNGATPPTDEQKHDTTAQSGRHAPTSDAASPEESATRATVPTNGTSPAPFGEDASRPHLPQRSPQTNLAPQLRAEQHSSDVGPSHRPPEEVRQAMSALQTGTQQARSTAEPPHGGSSSGGNCSAPDEESE